MTSNLIQHVSQLMQFEETVIESLYAEIEATDIPWCDSYPNYQSGGWQIASLYNSTGDIAYGTPEELEMKPTPLIKQLPQIQKFLDTTLAGLEFLMVRLTRSLPNAGLYEHADYAGMEKHQKLRLHLPLHTHPTATLSLVDVKVHLKKGYLWKLDPKSAVHGTCNLWNEPRVHLIMDCYLNPALEALVQNEWLDTDAVTELPEITHEQTRTLMTQSKYLLEQGQPSEAEQCLLNSFHSYRHPQGSSSYDLILDLYEKHDPSSVQIKYWSDRLAEVYGEEHLQKRLCRTAQV